MKTVWDPGQYLRYGDERSRPFWDLVQRVPTQRPRRVLDLGCGPGSLTAALLGLWPDALVTGVDASLTMIAAARPLDVPGQLDFVHGDIREWTAPAASVDVILSNATLQWVPGHVELLAQWRSWLAPGGTIAFQVPGNGEAPSHVALEELAHSAEWSRLFADVPDRPIVPPSEVYAERLGSMGASVDRWETTYYHVLSGLDPVLEWVRGSALRPYLGRLEADDAAAFTAQYARRLRELYPMDPSGATVYAFRRIFVVAHFA